MGQQPQLGLYDVALLLVKFQDYQIAERVYQRMRAAVMW